MFETSTGKLLNNELVVDVLKQGATHLILKPCLKIEQNTMQNCAEEFNLTPNLSKELQSLQSKQDIMDNNVKFLGVLNAIESFNGKGTCRAEVMKLFEHKGIHKFDTILSQSEYWLTGYLTHPYANPHGLSTDEILAIVLYTFDLKMSGTREENLYFQLNCMLQKRNITQLELWKGYLYFLQKGLSCLDNQKIKVYRGIPQEKLSLIQKEYTLGRRIHWSAYTSTSSDIDTALGFASPGGIIMEISVTTGKFIAEYSILANESEVLLSPNMGFYVATEVVKKGDYFFVNLVQESPSKTFVF